MFEETLIQVGQLRLNHAVGPDNGAPILLLHGVTRSWRDFAPVLPALVSSHRVTALDMRGHGKSDRASTYLVADYVRDVLAYLRNYSAHPPIIWGHSLGAMVAAACAASLPDRVAALILEDPPFHTMGSRLNDTLFSFFSGLQQCAEGVGGSAADMARRIAAIRMPTPDGKTVSVAEVRDATQIRFGARCVMDLDPSTLGPIVSGGWLHGYDLEHFLGKVRCPTLLLAADYGAGGMLTPEDAGLVQSLIGDCTRIDLNGCGHLIHWQRTEDVLRHIHAFLASL